MRDKKPVEIYATVPPVDADQRVCKLYEYWLSLRPSDRDLPGRQHFDPAAIPELLPWVWMMDVQREPLRFKHHLLGTEHVRVMGRDFTGMWLDDAYPLFLASPAYPQFVAAARGEVGYRRGMPLFHLSKEYVSLERLLLPLGQNGRKVDVILAITVYQRPF